jgi:hypothetical protein
LIMWTWSRKPSNIIFSDLAVDEIYKRSIQMANIYSFSIPLVQGENIRVKIAKLAVSFAARLYSNKEDGKILFVSKVHVDCAAKFLDTIYTQESCGYLDMSRIQRSIDVGDNLEDIKKADAYFNAFTNSKPRLLKCLLKSNLISPRGLMEEVNVTMPTSYEIIAKLSDLNLISRKDSNVFSKNPALTKWLKKMVLGSNESKKIFGPGGTNGHA